jgi:hypothetical protein
MVGTSRFDQDSELQIRSLRYVLVGIALTVSFFLGLGVFIDVYGINVPFFDDWTQLAAIPSHLEVSSVLNYLWTQHNENRMVFPNLLTLVMAEGHLLNYKYEMYASLVLWSLGFILISRSVPVGNGMRSFILIQVGLAVIWFVPLQMQNVLWGFQFAWYLCTFGLIYGVDVIYANRPSKGVLHWSKFVHIVVLGFVTSMSSVQGLIFWPVVLVLSLKLRYPMKKVGMLLGSSLLAMFFYFWHFRFTDLGGGGLSYGSRHPLVLGRFTLALLGNFVASIDPSLGLNRTIQVAIAIGAVLLGLTVVAVILVIFGKPDILRHEALFLGLAGYGICATVLTAVGRAEFGYEQAIQTRYIMFSLSVVVANFLLFSSVTFGMHSRGSVALQKVISIVLLVEVAFVAYGAASGVRVLAGQTYRMRLTSLVAIEMSRELRSTSFNNMITQSSFPFPTAVRAEIPKLYRLDRPLSRLSNLELSYMLSELVPVVSRNSSPSAVEDLQLLYLSRPDLEARFPSASPSLWFNLKK